MSPKIARKKPVAGRRKTAPRPRTTQAVQVSFTSELLRRLDEDADTKARGRSAIVREALEFYLQKKAGDAIDAEIHRAYGAPGVAEELSAEAEPLIAGQLWPPDDDLIEVGSSRPARSSRRG